MANVTFSSPIMHKDVTVYAIAGDTDTLLALADKHGIKIPRDCRDGQCGSCLIQVERLDDKPAMAISLTEKEKTKLLELGKITKAQIQDAEVNDMAPPNRLACQYIVRDENILVRFTGEPGGA